MEDENYYVTSDLGLASVLSLTHTIEKTDKSNLKRVLFYFQKTPKLEKLCADYWNKKLKVEPQAFFMQTKVLKNMIYEQA